MVVCDVWWAWQDSRTHEAREFKNLVLVTSFWSNAENIAKDLQPLYTIFCLVDKEGSIMGLLYEFMLKVGDMLLIANRLSTDQLLQVGQRWTSRWDAFITQYIMWHIFYIHCGIILWVMFLLSFKMDGHLTWTFIVMILWMTNFKSFYVRKGLLHEKMLICKTPCWPLYLGGKNLEYMFQNFKFWH
jgi:hypothetical protein